MRKLALTAILLFCYRDSYAQTVAAVAPVPVFQPLDNNGLPVPGGTVCSYSAGTSSPVATYTTSAGNVANTNPVILDSSGRANIWLTVSTKLVFSRPGSGCPSSGAQIWSVDGISPITQDVVFNSVVSQTLFNSRADVNGGNAFQTQGGTVHITGAGDVEGQEIGGNHFSLIGFASAPTPPGAGFAFLYYDSTIGAIRYNLGGAGWVNIPAGVSGSGNWIQYNCGGAFCSSTNFTFNPSTNVLAIGGSVTAGVTAPVFSSTNTGTDNAFVAGGGAAVLTGDGNWIAQNFKAHSVFNSQADVYGGNAFQTSGGTMVITGAGAIAGQSVAVTTGFTANGQTGVTGSTCSHFEGGICTTL